MKEIFNRRFLKFFIITFFLVFLLNLVGATVNYLELYFENPVSPVPFFNLSFGVALELIPAALCVSTALASFVSFRNLPVETDTRGFIRKLGIGLVCFIPLAITVYWWDMYIQPRFQAKTIEILWDLRSGRPVRMVGDESLKPPVFKNFNAGLSTKEVLDFRIDSLEKKYNEWKEEAGRLLSQLPDTAAAQAYEAYGLEWLEVDYQYTPIPTGLEKEKVIHIQQEELFYIAENLYEIYMKRLQYRFERYKRMINAWGLILQYLIFAALGYFSRKNPIQNIFGVMAIIMISCLFIYQLTTMGKQYANEAKKKAQEYEREMRDRRFNRQSGL